MGLVRYQFDGSSLSATDRIKLEKFLEDWAETGLQIVDIKNSLYEGDFYENTDISELPVPHGTIVTTV